MMVAEKLADTIKQDWGVKTPTTKTDKPARAATAEKKDEL